MNKYAPYSDKAEHDYVNEVTSVLIRAKHELDNLTRTFTAMEHIEESRQQPTSSPIHALFMRADFNLSTLDVTLQSIKKLVKERIEGKKCQVSQNP